MRLLLVVTLLFSLIACKCPISGLCPYYETIPRHPGKECPLAKSCPYYDKMKDSSSILSIMTTEDHKCPLAKTNCSFYHNLENDKEKFNWKGTKCPIALSCPYYAKAREVMETVTTGTRCPVLSKCPHFAKKDPKHQVHRDYNSGEAAAQCPFLKQQQQKQQKVEL